MFNQVKKLNFFNLTYIYNIKYKKIKMSKEKSLVEDALIQMKNLEEAVAENAKGILASTMKEEISELVKESLSEEEEEVEKDVEVDFDAEDEDDSDEDESDDSDVKMTMNTDKDVESEIPSDMEEPIDLTDESDEEVLRVFELMGPDDKLIVKKDEAGNINLKDEDSMKEYMIVGESDEEEIDEEIDGEMYEEEMDENMEKEMYEDEESIDSIVDKVFGSDEEDEEYEEDEIIFYEELEENPIITTRSNVRNLTSEEETMYEIEMDEEEDEEDEESEFVSFMGEDDFEEDEEVVFEVEMGDELEESEEDELEESEEDDDDDEFFESDESLMEAKKMKSKAKGVGMGKAKFSYSSKPNMSGGFKTVKKKSDKSMGTGNAKKVNIYKDDTNMDGKMKVVKGSKKMETKEASRTLGNGKYWGRKGLPKPKSSPRHIRLESTNTELQILREKNEEYRKALNVFRNKLNEVAVFNSNLAYATRLFTEHSTSKQEKINILRRFDTVESLKESKNLYKQIKDELGNKKSESINESVDRVIQKVPSNGSSVNLIESKTYENPQFLRMKDLMSKLR